MTPYIETRGLSYSYEDTDGNLHPALEDVSIEIPRGQFVAVLGHNGSGKSTLAKLLNMILIPTKGEIYVDGRLVSSPGEPDEDVIFDVRRRIGMVHQNPDNQIVASVVEEDVAFGPENLGLSPDDIRLRVDASLEAVGMRSYATSSPSRLSGGQKQRVAIAGIIAMLPECIIFDESTSMLDPAGRRDVMNTILSLNRGRGMTVIHITHDMAEAALADRVIVLSDGRVTLDGAPDDIFARVEEMRAVRLDVPQSTALLYALRDTGIRPPEKTLSARACAEYIKDEIERLSGAALGNGEDDGRDQA